MGDRLKKKRGGGVLSLIFILTNLFQSYLSLSDWWCVFCLFMQYLSVFIVFHGKNLVLLNLINRSVASTIIFEKQNLCGTL